MSQTDVLKELIHNPVHKCIRHNHNPFILLPIYENSDLYEEVKCSYREAIISTKDAIVLFSGDVSQYNRARRTHYVKQLDSLNEMYNILDEFSVDLPDDELMTYQLL